MIKKNIIISTLFSILATGCGGDSSPGPSSNDIAQYEKLPYSFSKTVKMAGESHVIKLEKFSVRQKDAKFYILNAGQSTQAQALSYTPEVRSYRGKVVGQPESMIIGYVDGNNKFYGRVFYGGIKSWEISDLPIAQKAAHLGNKVDINRSPADLQLTSDSHQLPAPSLASPIPSNSDFYLQRADIAFIATEDAYTRAFGNNLESTIGALDYMANFLDYVFTRDALIRFSYPGGLIVQKAGSVTKGSQNQQLREKLKGKFSLLHTLEGARNSGSNAGLSSLCGFSLSAWCTLHEVGHAFNLGHNIGPETNSVMGAVELIPTNAISVMKSSPGATKGTIVGALQSPISPNANIDHLDITRDQKATINVLDNDFDANGPLPGGKIKVHSVDSHSIAYGRITWEENGNVTYQAPKGFVGDDHFNYTIIDDSGMKDESEVHVKVLSDSRVAFFKKNQYTTRHDLKNYSGDNHRVDQVHNLAGKESFVSLTHQNSKYQNLGFVQQLLMEGSYDTVYEKNNTMSLRDYMPHELVPGKSSFSVSLVFTQDGDFISRLSSGELDSTTQELALIGQGKLDDGYALSYFNGNRHRIEAKGAPAKGLGWTLVSRQLFTQQNFGQRPHEIHAYAAPDAVTVNDNKPHIVTWVIDRQKNTVSTYVDGTVVPMVLDDNPTHSYDHVPLPADFGGVYPGGTNYWYSAGRDLYTESYGPWFMRTLGGSNSIWDTSTRFISDKMDVDNVQMFTYALSEQQIKQLAKGHYPAYSASPINGQEISFDTPILLKWDNDAASEFRVTYGQDSSLSSPLYSKSVGTSKSLSVNINNATDVLYWRVDSKINNQWVNGHVWSTRNQLHIGPMLSLTFTNDELTGSNAPDVSPWPVNTSKSFGDVQVNVSKQKETNGRSTLLLRGEEANITLTSQGGREIKQMNIALSGYDTKTLGELAIQYKAGSQWKDAKVLYKDGVPTGQNFNGDYTGKPAIGNRKNGPSKSQYAPERIDNISTYLVTFPSGVFDVRVIVRGDSNVVAMIDQLDII